MSKSQMKNALFNLVIIMAVYSFVDGGEYTDTDGHEFEDSSDRVYEYDPNGYVFFCLCMGRIGNQMEHFLGGMSFAKSLNRTLVLPPFRTYMNVPFTDYFELEPFEKHLRVIPAEEFMKQIAPTYWPPGKRIGFCYQRSSGEEDVDCRMKEGNPFGPFWDGLGVDFDSYVAYEIPYYETYAYKWRKQFPPETYPVLAMRGAPASYPMQPLHRPNQALLKFTERITKEANQFVMDNFPGEKFIGIHLRNGPDWTNACQHDIHNMASFMASPQCTDFSDNKITHETCLPSKEQIVRDLKKVMDQTGINVIFVATDKDPMTEYFKTELREYDARIYHMDPWLPQMDQHILIRSSHFIGNCISSFTSFVKRARDIQQKPSSFWAFEITRFPKEL